MIWHDVARKKRGPHSDETKAKMRAAHLGRKNTAEHNANIAAARTGTKHTEATKRKSSSTKLAQHLHMSDSEKKRLSIKWTGPGNPCWGKTPKHGPRTHWVDYNGTSLRSSYEVRVAKALDRRGIKWEYEPKRFDLGSCTFLPDFYLPEREEYLEVKGWLDPTSQLKIKLFREQYPEIPLVVATDPVIKLMEA